jgi:hypothetical protein
MRNDEDASILPIRGLACISIFFRVIQSAITFRIEFKLLGEPLRVLEKELAGVT